MSDTRQPVPSPILGIVGLVVAAGLIILVMNARSGSSGGKQASPSGSDTKHVAPPEDPDPVKEDTSVAIPKPQANPPVVEAPKPLTPSPADAAAMGADGLRGVLAAVSDGDRAAFATDTLRALASGSTGSTEIVMALREAGADLNATGTQGRTPLMLAAASANIDAVFALLDCGADVWTKDADGMDAREHALARNDQRGYEIADVLENARPE